MVLRHVTTKCFLQTPNSSSGGSSTNLGVGKREKGGDDAVALQHVLQHSRPTGRNEGTFKTIQNMETCSKGAHCVTMSYFHLSSSPHFLSFPRTFPAPQSMAKYCTCHKVHENPPIPLAQQSSILNVFIPVTFEQNLNEKNTHHYCAFGRIQSTQKGANFKISSAANTNMQSPHVPSAVECKAMFRSQTRKSIAQGDHKRASIVDNVGTALVQFWSNVGPMKNENTRRSELANCVQGSTAALRPFVRTS